MTVFDELHDSLNGGLEAREYLPALLGGFGVVNGAGIRRGQFGDQYLRFFSRRLDRSRGRLNLLRGPHDLLLDNTDESRVVVRARFAVRDPLQDVLDGRRVLILQIKRNNKGAFKESRSGSKILQLLSFTETVLKVLRSLRVLSSVLYTVIAF